jgi:N-acetylglucosaminyldiphosphoundecaprenol N-acetyl-beta-D-mannosaminyltransferase
MLAQETHLPLVQAEATQRTKLISLNISVGSYDSVQDWMIQEARRRVSRMVCFANVHMVVEAQRNATIAQAVNNADWVTPDGVPLVWAMRGLHQVKQERVAGMDITASLLERASKEGISVFFYGSTPQLLDRIREVCNDRFPSLQIAGMISPPFRAPTPAEDSETITQISASGAGLLFVALGCPKQELWMSRMQGKIPAVMLGIGNALAVFAGEEERSPGWMQKAGLEWCFRLAQEPRRLLKRYAVTNSLYVYYILRQFMKKQDINLTASE